MEYLERRSTFGGSGENRGRRGGELSRPLVKWGQHSSRVLSTIGGDILPHELQGGETVLMLG